TGIDIRKGLQYECIGCAACVDACDQVMDKMGYPKGLIRYTTQNALANQWSFRQTVRRVFRPRVIIYGSILLAITAALFLHLAWRVPLKVDVLRDRNMLGREVEDGSIENVYRLQVMNTEENGRRYRVTVEGLGSSRVATGAEIDVEAAGTRLAPIAVRVPQGQGKPGSNPIVFRIEAVDDPAIAVREKSTFYVPR
ncbi:MAG TPA: FixG Ig-like domain-containing protein, partial [Burkholderiaceae bacterium]|nr:FixG Ig-like domain-containing protein [Burkholderiaceae bacterium]